MSLGWAISYLQYTQKSHKMIHSPRLQWCEAVKPYSKHLAGKYLSRSCTRAHSDMSHRLALLTRQQSGPTRIFWLLITITCNASCSSFCVNLDGQSHPSVKLRLQALAERGFFVHLPEYSTADVSGRILKQHRRLVNCRSNSAEQIPVSNRSPKRPQTAPTKLDEKVNRFNFSWLLSTVGPGVILGHLELSGHD